VHGGGAGVITNGSGYSGTYPLGADKFGSYPLVADKKENKKRAVNGWDNESNLLFAYGM